MPLQAPPMPGRSGKSSGNNSSGNVLLSLSEVTSLLTTSPPPLSPAFSSHCTYPVSGLTVLTIRVSVINRPLEASTSR